MTKADDPYARKYKKENPVVTHYTRKYRADGPNTRQEARHGRYLDYGLMPPGYERSHTKYAKWLKTQGNKGKTGGTRRRHRKSRSTRRR